MLNRKLFVVGGYNEYANWIKPLGFTLVEDETEADVLLFTGGVDVNPELYGENIGAYTQRPYSQRDNYEKEMYDYAVSNNKPMIGVCRGNQFLCVMNGGKLVQDSTHPYMHKMITSDGREIITNSMHHQQALLTNVDPNNYILLGWAERISRHHLNGDNVDYRFPTDYKEPEVIFWPKTKSIGFQMHPEAMNPVCDLVKYCQEMVSKYI